jgi:hypothetical protein
MWPKGRSVSRLAEEPQLRLEIGSMNGHLVLASPKSTRSFCNFFTKPNYGAADEVCSLMISTVFIGTHFG